MKSRIGRGIGVMSIAAGIAVTGMSTDAHAVGEPVPLNNDSPGSSVPTGTGSCDVYGLDATASYWHFVLSENPYAFESISLNIGGTQYTFTANQGQYETNGKVDQAFIKVPDGKSLSDLMASGSFANVTPDPYSSNVNFVLSHECTASGYEETTTTEESTTTSSTTTTEAPAVVITPSSQVGSEAPVIDTTTTTSTSTTQPSEVGAQGPQDVTLPATGSRTTSGLEIGLGMVVAGLILSVLSRRRTADNGI